MYPTQDTTEVSIAQYTEVLRRRWLWIVMVPLVLVGFTLFNDLRAEPVYSAQAEILLQAKPSENVLTGAVQTIDPARALQNELRVIRSRNVRLAVAEAYGSPVFVTAVAGGEDDVIIVRATANDPDEAAERVNAYVSTYQTARLDTLLEDLTNTKEIIQQQIDDFQAQVDAVNEPLAALDLEIAQTSPDDPRYNELVANRQRVKERTDAERNEAQNQLADYQERLQVLQISERLTTTGGVQILNPATPPRDPISPTTVRNAIQALIVGLFLGVALAFARDQLDDSIRTKADLDRAVKDLPSLALIPEDSISRSADRELVTIAAPMSAGAEAYRSLRTSIQHAHVDRPIRLLQITSANAGEGKTTTISNLAVAFAQAGRKVIVVGCDLRKPMLQRTLEVDGSVGLTSVVLGYQSLNDAIQTSPRHPNVDVLASGPLPPNPSELLNHERTATILRSLADQYSMVFIDCPPVLPVTDSLVLSRNVDATLFLARSTVTTRRGVKRAIEMLTQVDSPVVGTVLTGVAGEEVYGSFYEYYGYAAPSRIPFVSRWRKRKHDQTSRLADEALPEDEARAAEEPPTTDEVDTEPGDVEVAEDQTVSS